MLSKIAVKKPNNKYPPFNQFLANNLIWMMLRGWFYTVIHACVNRQHSHANYINLEVFPVNHNYSRFQTFAGILNVVCVLLGNSPASHIL